MPAILRKSLTACEALAALPPTPRMNSRPPADAGRGKNVHDAIDGGGVEAVDDLPGFGEKLLGESHVFLLHPEVSSELLNAGERSDLVKPVGNFEGRQFPVGRAVPDTARPDPPLRRPERGRRRLAAGPPGRNRCTACAASAASYCRRRCGRRRIPRCWCPTGPHCGYTVISAGLAAFARRPLDGAQSHGQVGIAVEHEEALAEQRQSALSARRRCRAGRVRRTNSRRGGRRRRRRRPIPASSRRDSRGRGRRDSMPLARSRRNWCAQKGLAVDLHQRLGDRLGHRAQARGQAAGQNGHGQHHECATTWLPSKSNRKRTSRRPAAVIARAQAGLVLRVEHEEAAAAGADQLAAQRAVVSVPSRTTRRSGIAHAAGRAFLCSQWTCISSANPRRSPLSSAALLSMAQFLHEVQVVDHALVVLPAARVLVLQDARRRCGCSR